MRPRLVALVGIALLLSGCAALPQGALVADHEGGQQGRPLTVRVRSAEPGNLALAWASILDNDPTGTSAARNAKVHTSSVDAPANSLVAYAGGRHEAPNDGSHGRWVISATGLAARGVNAERVLGALSIEPTVPSVRDNVRVRLAAPADAPVSHATYWLFPSTYASAVGAVMPLAWTGEAWEGTADVRRSANEFARVALTPGEGSVLIVVAGWKDGDVTRVAEIRAVLR